MHCPQLVGAAPDHLLFIRPSGGAQGGIEGGLAWEVVARPASLLQPLVSMGCFKLLSFFCCPSTRIHCACIPCVGYLHGVYGMLCIGCLRLLSQCDFLCPFTHATEGSAFCKYCFLVCPYCASRPHMPNMGCADNVCPPANPAGLQNLGLQLRPACSTCRVAYTFCNSFNSGKQNCC